MDFDARAREWDKNPLTIERTAVVAAAIRQAVTLEPTWHALEYGCGTGALSFALLPDLGRVTLIDTSAGMLTVLREKIVAAGVTNMQVVQRDLVNEPNLGEHFDLIYSSMALHHVHDTRKILGVFHDLLKPGGRLAIVDLDTEDGSFHDRGGFDGHCGFERAALGALCEEAGFVDVRFVTAHTMVKESAGVKREYPVFLMTARRERR